MTISIFGVLLFGIYFAQCSELQTDSTLPLEANSVQHSKVNFQKWVYYKFEAPAHKGFTLYVEHSKGTNKKHDIDIYIKKGGSLPERSSYDYYDLSIDSNITMNIASELVNMTYIVGVYGFTGGTTFFNLHYQFNNGCPQNCNNYGLCRNNVQCVCYPGHVGSYCQYIATSVVLGTTYNAILPAFNWVYYSIDIYAANNLQIEVFTTSQTGDVDLYLHYQTIPDYTTFDYFDVGTSKNFSINVVSPLLGTWYLGFHAISTTSFSFKVTEQRACPMNCSLHGSCIGSTCHCNSDFIGLTCEEAVNSLTSTSIHGYVGANYWNFYKYNANSDNPFLVQLTEKGVSSKCDLYILSGTKPTKFMYTYANETEQSVTEILVSHPLNQIWWIGIYGFSSCEYDILVIQETHTVCGNCGHGVCLNEACKCNEGWFGVECNVMPQALINGQRTAVDSVTMNNWKYYTLHLNHTSLLAIVLSEQSTIGQLWLYIAKEIYPTLDSYEVGNIAPVATHRISLEFFEPKTIQYVIGVYGSPFATTAIQYTLAAYATPF